MRENFIKIFAFTILVFLQQMAFAASSSTCSQSQVLYYRNSLVPYISAKDFGAQGTGQVDDTRYIQLAVDCASDSGKELRIPSGIYKITKPIEIRRPITLIGEGMPAPKYGGKAGTNPVETVLVSYVQNDYFIKYNSNTIGYQMGGRIENIHLLGYPYARTIAGANTSESITINAKINGHGLQINGCGWNGYFKNILAEGFNGTGIELNYVQDSVFEQISVIDSGIESGIRPGQLVAHGAPALLIVQNGQQPGGVGSNSLMFLRLHLEANPYQMAIQSAQDIEFHDAHIEQGEYASSAGLQSLISKSTPITIDHSTNIKFIGGLFVPNSIGGDGKKDPGIGLMDKDAPYYFVVTNSTNVSFSDGAFMGPLQGDRSKFMQYSASQGQIHNCIFKYATVGSYSIDLDGEVAFTSNEIIFNDTSHGVPGIGNMMYGIKIQGGNFSNNKLSLGVSSGSKSEGYILFGGKSSLLGDLTVLGFNDVRIYPPSLNNFHNGQFYTMSNDKENFAGIGLPTNGILDLGKYDPNQMLTVLYGGSFSQLLNGNVAQEVTFVNAGGPFTIINNNNSQAGSILLKGSTNAVVPTNGSITLVRTNDGRYIEKIRNF
ncbi:MAG: hypothetical protein HQL13_06060 [Candidatus Omnitrophica bacterium]|nr:hypothetical protein [Candidatus Omnitrophota bacterium]